MKNFKKYDDFLLEFKDNWAMADALSGTIFVIKKLYGKLKRSAKRIKLKRVRNSYDNYLESVYDNYLDGMDSNNQLPSSNSNTNQVGSGSNQNQITNQSQNQNQISNSTQGQIPNTKPATQIGTGVNSIPQNNPTTNPNNSNSSTNNNTNNNSNTTNNNVINVANTNSNTNVKHNTPVHTQSQHTNDDDDDTEEEDVDVFFDDIESIEYFEDRRENLENDLHDILAIPNQAATEDYKEWEQKVKDFSQDIENIIDDIHDILTRTNEQKKKAYLNNLLNIVQDWLHQIHDHGISVNESKVYESDEWLGDAVEVGDDWSDKDKEAITKMVNSYKIEEFILLKTRYCDKDEKLLHYWEEYQNSIFKKWHLIFNVEDLRSKTKKISAISTGKEKQKKADNLVVLDYLDESFTVKDTTLPKIIDSSYMVYNDVNLNLLYLLYKADNDIFKVVGEITLNENSVNNDLKWDLNRITKILKVKDKKYNAHTGKDNFMCIMLEPNGKDLKVIFNKNTSTKVLKVNDDYILREIDKNEVLKLINKSSNIKRPEHDVDQDIIDLFK